MISIIICSRKADVLADFLDSVERTIGVPYEPVVIDNTDNKFNIFTAYNYGASLAKGDILLFAHEDIIMRSEGWGATMEQCMAEDPGIGMIGVVGTQCAAKAPRGWNTWGMQGRNIRPMCRLVQNMGDHKYSFEGEECFHMETVNPENVRITQAIGVDGLMFAIRRSLFDEGKVRFDEETYEGFHVYDMDMSMQVAQHMKVMVLLDIELKHISCGNRTKDYYTSYYQYYMKWKDRLPMGIYPLTDPASFNQFNALPYFRGMVKSGFFSKEEIRHYSRGYLATIADERKTRYYYALIYYTRFYHRFGVGRLVTGAYNLGRRLRERFRTK